MIYFLQAELIGRIKIGFTSQEKMSRRLSGLQTASPVPLCLLGSIKGGREKERELHERFADYRVHGEWFTPGPRLVEFIARIQNRAPRQPRPRREGRAHRAARWLIEAFATRRRWPSDELFQAAREAGVNRCALFEARAALDLPKAAKETTEGGTRWAWWVPQSWSPPQVMPQLPQFATVVEAQGLTTGGYHEVPDSWPTDPTGATGESP